MSFDVWLLGLIAIVFTGAALHALVKGETKDEVRGTDPLGYWLTVAVLVAIAALHLWMLARALGGDGTARVSAALILAPLCLYLFLKSLRSGEVVWGNNRFPRGERAQAYWTILLLCFVGFVFFAGSAAYRAMSGQL